MACTVPTPATGTPHPTPEPGALRIDAILDLSGPHAAALRDALEGITMALIATTYSFAAGRHAGSDPDDLAFVRWNGSALATAPAPSVRPIASPSP